MGSYNTTAKKGYHFVLTKKGYKKTPDKVKPERKAGYPVRGFERRVPTSWIEKGYVEEIKMKTINEQIKELRDLSEGYTAGGHKDVGNKLREAADTIETLSAKLAANTEPPDSHYRGGWIAVNDRLPELNRFYIVTTFDGEDHEVEPAYYAKIGFFGERNIKPNWWSDCTSNAEMIEEDKKEVIAWRPLPDPYIPNSQAAVQEGDNP